jgi:hypothetical protein
MKKRGFILGYCVNDLKAHLLLQRINLYVGSIRLYGQTISFV